MIDSHQKLSPWWRHSVILTMIFGFTILIVLAVRTYEDAPPIPDQVDKEYGCVWLDVFGSVTPQSIGRAKPGGNQIPYLFRDKNNQVVFHTTFIYNKTSDTWKWVMDNDTDGKLQPFARLTMTRKVSVSSAPRPNSSARRPD